MNDDEIEEPEDDEEQDEDELAEPPMPEGVGGMKLDLVPPENLAERWDLHWAMQDTDGSHGKVCRVFAAALGLCSPRLRRFLAKDRIRYKGDVLEFGGQVTHYLLSNKRKKPAKYREIFRAGRAAYRLSEDALVTNEKIEEAEGFSSAPGAPSPPSSSTSSEPGGVSLDGSAPSRPT